MLLTLVLFTSLLTEDLPVHVEKHPPTTQFVSFDPGHPPADVEKLQHGENALTQMLFNCTVKLKYNAIDRREGEDGKWHVVAQLDDVTVILELMNKIYLPEHANAKLRAHELGHARINGMIYQDAETAARRAAENALHRKWEADGADPDAAGKAATDKAVNAICNRYLKATADKAFRIGEIYDDLTKHGTNAKQEDDAIREAMQKYAEEKR
jgi:hypothetical protein